MKYHGVLERHGVRLAFKTASSRIWQVMHERWGSYLGARSAGEAMVLEILPAPVIGECFRFSLAWSGPRLLVTAGGCRGMLEGRGSGHFIVSDDPRYPRQLSFLLENILRLGWSRNAALAGGLLVHGVGLAAGDPPRGVLLVGTSGSGKSTAAALAANCLGVDCLGDDLVMLGGEGGPWVGDTPFTPFAGRAERKVPLSGVLLLARGIRHRVIPLLFAEGFSGMLTQCLIKALSPRETVPVLSRVESWLQDIPLGRLEFNKDPGFWKEVECFTGHVLSRR